MEKSESELVNGLSEIALTESNGKNTNLKGVEDLNPTDLTFENVYKQLGKRSLFCDCPRKYQVFLQVDYLIRIYPKYRGFSKFQIFAAVTILLIEIPGALIALSPILTSTSQVDFYCVTDEFSTLLSKEKLCNSSCKGNISSKQPFISIVQEWNLICDRAWVSDTLTSVYMIGSTLGPLLTSQISDRFGRKPAFFSICLLLAISGLLSSITVDVYSYAVLRFVSGLIAGGCIVASMNYLLEFLTPSWRVMCACGSFWPAGEMLLGLLGYLFSSWRIISWGSVISASLLLLAYPFLPESPRWLLCKNRTTEAEKVLKTIAKWNSKPPLDSETVKNLQFSVLKEKDHCVTQNGSDMAELSRWSTFKDIKVLKIMVIFAIGWFANAVTYYGIAFNMKNMSGNPYLNVFLMGVLDYSSQFSGIYFSNRFGRKIIFILWLMLSTVLIAIVASIQLMVEHADAQYGTLILVLCLMGRFFNESSWCVMAVFTGESFPTIIRSISLGICTICSSLGGIIAPQMVYFGSIWAPGPYVVFCGLTTFSCLISLLLPEMNRKPLRDVHSS